MKWFSSEMESGENICVIQFNDLNEAKSTIQRTKSALAILDNTYNTAQMREWYERTASVLGQRDFEMVLESKIDGVSCSLTYKDGILVNAATRGDGKTGEEVTANIKTIKTIPHKLKKSVQGILEIRGEIFIK